MKFRVTSPYGAWEEIREHPHTGIDLAMPEGTPLRSIADAVVERVVDYGSYNIGKGVILRLPDGKEVIYGHMSKVTVYPGQHVSGGQLIGYSGNTGHSTGPHLHFGMKEDGHFIDPTPYIQYLEHPLKSVQPAREYLDNQWADSWFHLLDSIHHQLESNAHNTDSIHSLLDIIKTILI